jgi:hypothetical protein
LSANPAVEKKRGISGTTLYANAAVTKETQDLWHNTIRKSRGQKAAFVVQHCPQILLSQKKCGICDTPSSANPAFQKAGFVAQYYPQITWSKKDVGFVEQQRPQIPRFNDAINSSLLVHEQNAFMNPFTHRCQVQTV